MVLRLLQILLILAVVRAVWRLGKGVLEGAGYQRVDGPGRVAGSGKVGGVRLERDPVCGTYVSPAKAPVLRMGGETLYFCSDKCRREWERR
jgi:YHS domain-containing protein